MQQAVPAHAVQPAAQQEGPGRPAEQWFEQPQLQTGPDVRAAPLDQGGREPHPERAPAYRGYEGQGERLNLRDAFRDAAPAASDSRGSGDWAERVFERGGEFGGRPVNGTWPAGSEETPRRSLAPPSPLGSVRSDGPPGAGVFSASFRSSAGGEAPEVAGGLSGRRSASVDRRSDRRSDRAGGSDRPSADRALAAGRDFIDGLYRASAGRSAGRDADAPRRVSEGQHAAGPVREGEREGNREFARESARGGRGSDADAAGLRRAGGDRAPPTPKSAASHRDSFEGRRPTVPLAEPYLADLERSLPRRQSAPRAEKRGESSDGRRARPARDGARESGRGDRRERGKRRHSKRRSRSSSRSSSSASEVWQDESPDRMHLRRPSAAKHPAREPEVRTPASEVGDSPVKPNLSYRERRSLRDAAPATPDAAPAARQRRATEERRAERQERPAPRSSYKEMRERLARPEAQAFDDYG